MKTKAKLWLPGKRRSAVNEALGFMLIPCVRRSSGIAGALQLVETIATPEEELGLDEDELADEELDAAIFMRAFCSGRRL